METIHNYWKSFNRKENFRETYNLKDVLNENDIPKFFKMKSELDEKRFKSVTYK